MWMMPLHLHAFQNPDNDDDEECLYPCSYIGSEPWDMQNLKI